MTSTFEATYRITSAGMDVRDFAEAVLLEQTFETPTDVVERYPHLAHRRGRILSIESDNGRAHLVRFAFPDDVARESPAQFLNALFGNASLHRELELIDVEPSDEILQMLGGPRFGVDGLRRRLDVHDRPLTCTALKPVGLSLEELVTLCRTFAENGIDLIKDDHYLGDHPEAPFAERVSACQEMVREVGARQGREIWYVPNVTGTPDRISEHMEVVHREGVRAVMAAPYLMGLPTFHAFVRDVDLPILAHPTFSGNRSIAAAMSWGKLTRLFGADGSIFANSGGRFSLGTEDCRMISAMLSTPIGSIKRAFPVPAGGMDVSAVDDVVRFYGNDVILLVGGSLLRAKDLAAATRQFVDRVHSASLLST